MFRYSVVKHVMAILIAVFSFGYKGKTVQFAQVSSCHRTTIAHFLNKGKWDSEALEEILKKAVRHIIYEQARQTGKPIYCFVDDTISSKTKPSSQALHPIQDAYFHQSHLKKYNGPQKSDQGSKKEREHGMIGERAKKGETYHGIQTLHAGVQDAGGSGSVAGGKGAGRNRGGQEPEPEHGAKLEGGVYLEGQHGL